MAIKRKDDAETPRFKSLEEEREYWEARGPLARGRKAEVNKAKPAELRRSFISVRLTGEELTRLRDAAAGVGLGPSTFARAILVQALQSSRESLNLAFLLMLARQKDNIQ